MHCRNCGKPVEPHSVACLACGASPTAGNRFCQHCGNETDPVAFVCVKCGVRLLSSTLPAPLFVSGAKSRLAAGLLGILLGSLGVHRFYLGHVAIGVAQIVVTFVTCGIGSIWGFIEGIVILAGGLVDRDADGNLLGP
jgi:TM2 domain-containing membrane protein YozV